MTKLLFPLLLCTATTGFAVTTAQFDGGADTPWSGGQFGDPAGPLIGSGNGPDGSDALQLTTDGVNGQGNTVAFGRTIVGPQPVVPFSFDFRLGPQAASADGFSFALLPTSAFGTSGQVGFAGLDEDPDFAGQLAFGFDTWGNGGPFDAGGSGSDYTDISLFWDNNLIASHGGLGGLPDPRGMGLTIDDDTWHNVNGVVNFAAGTVSMTVDAFTIFNNTAVPGLTAYEWRLGIGARTGGEDENAWFDNISVGIPEPASTGLAALGLALLARRRR